MKDHPQLCLQKLQIFLAIVCSNLRFMLRELSQEMYYLTQQDVSTCMFLAASLLFLVDRKDEDFVLVVLHYS